MILILQENKINFQFLSKQIFIEQLTIFEQANSYLKRNLTIGKWICYTSNVGKVDKKGFENPCEIIQLAFLSKLRKSTLNEAKNLLLDEIVKHNNFDI